MNEVRARGIRSRWLTVILVLSSGVIHAQTASGQSSESAPDPAEQDRLLEMMHAYAARYVSSLPNFLCMQVTRQMEAGKKSNRWRNGDTLVGTLAFNEGREHRSLDLVNGKPVKPGRKHWQTPLVTEGEFGILLSRVLGPSSEAFFTWNRWENLRGRRLAVFDFSVDKQHSTLSLSLSDLVKAIVPYTGTVHADPTTGAVWRITDTASKIPPALLTREISTTIDYDEIQIGTNTYLLPIQATVSLMMETKKVRNEMEFQNYRKFEADSAISFGPEVTSGDKEPSKPRSPKP